MPQFLYRFTPGERPELGESLDAWTEEDQEVGERHFDHLQQGAAAGLVILAGRSQDWAGPAIVILETDSEDEARRFMESDPFVAEGLFGASLHPFRIALERG